MGDCEELSLELSMGGKYAGKSNCESGNSRFDFSETDDLQSRREIQASRRQEARRKREEKVKRSRFVNGKLFVEAQRFQGRVRDREVRENELNFERKNGSDEVADELGLSLFSEKKESLYPKVQLVQAKSDSENSDGVKSVGQCPDFYSIGGAGSRPWQAELKQESSSSPASASESGGEARKGERRIPCVSATGEGPNGRRVMGFLYKYDKREVSIMCVCHGSSFSPAEFVEHAGCRDVSHPLRHITVVT